MRTGASEQFATQVERALRPGAAAPADGGADGAGDRTAALVAVAVELREAGRPLLAVVPRQDFRAALAQRLADEAAELAPARQQAARELADERAAEGVRRPPRRTVSERRRKVRGVVAGVVALVVAGGAGAAVASESALPGGALYPLKRQVEDLRLGLSSPGAARGGTELALARERLVEAEDLAIASGGADVPATDTPQLRSTLDDFGSSAEAGIDQLTQDYARTGDATSLAAVNTFLDETLPLLERLRTMTPPSLHPVVDDLIARLGDARTELAGVVAGCTTCDELGLVVAVEPSPSVSSPAAVPDAGGATAGPLPSMPATVPPVAGGGTGGEPGSGGGLLDPLDPVLDPLDPVLDPVETVIGGVLPTPSANPTSTPLLPLPTLPSLPLPSVTLPPLLPPSTSASTSPTCLLIICG